MFSDIISVILVIEGFTCDVIGGNGGVCSNILLWMVDMVVIVLSLNSVVYVFVMIGAIILIVIVS